MFDIGWQEIFIVGVLALIVVGPKDLPRALRTGSQWLRKARSLAREFQGGLNEVIREADLDDLKKQVSDAQDFDINKAIEKHVDDGTLDEELNISDSAAGLELEGDYRKRKQGAEERARRQIEGEEQRISTAEEDSRPEDRELDDCDEDEKPAEDEAEETAEASAEDSSGDEPAKKTGA